MRLCRPLNTTLRLHETCNQRRRSERASRDNQSRMNRSPAVFADQSDLSSVR